MKYVEKNDAMLEKAFREYTKTSHFKIMFMLSNDKETSVEDFDRMLQMTGAKTFEQFWYDYLEKAGRLN